jgi:hypothetical protein
MGFRIEAALNVEEMVGIWLITIGNRNDTKGIAGLTLATAEFGLEAI